MNTEEIKLLQAQNEALKRQCNSLQQEVKQWKHEYEMLDACIELEQEKVTELKEEVKQLHKGRNPEELYTLFGKPIKYWEELEAENDRLKARKDKYYQQTLDDEIKLNELYQTLQEIKGAITALYMNNWVQMNETARKSIQLLQELITKAEEEWK